MPNRTSSLAHKLAWSSFYLIPLMGHVFDSEFLLVWHNFPQMDYWVLTFWVSKIVSSLSIDCVSFISLHQQGYKVTKQGISTITVGWKVVSPTTHGGKDSSTTNMNVHSATGETMNKPSMPKEVFFNREVCCFLPSTVLFLNICLVLFQTYSIRTLYYYFFGLPTLQTTLKHNKR